MKATTINEDTSVTTFEVIHCENIKDVFYRAAELQDNGYIMIQSFDENDSDCLYTYQKLMDDGVEQENIIFLFKDDETLKYVKTIPENDTEGFYQNLLQDLIYVLWLVKKLKNDGQEELSNDPVYVRSLLDECWYDDREQHVHWK